MDIRVGGDLVVVHHRYRYCHWEWWWDNRGVVTLNQEEQWFDLFEGGGW